MQRNLRKWIAFTAALGFGLMVATVGAQDYPTHKGSSQRAGHNGDAYSTSPGLGNLRWWHPDNTEFNLTAYIRDNTSSLCTKAVGWFPSVNGSEAYSTFVPTRTGNSGYDALVSSFFDPASSDYNDTPITPTYHFARALPSRWTGNPLTYDPTIPASGVARTVTWNVTPTTGVAGMYSLYVWLPAGPTTSGGQTYYPQRYYVYKVSYGSGLTYTEVVDTNIAGTGWVRLGGRGAATERAFAYDGVNPITISLYNLIPCDSTGKLLVTDTSKTYLVYADAAMSAPIWGSYSASPIVSMLSSSLETVTLAAFNSMEVGKVGSVSTMLKKGIVTSYTATTGVKRWSFAPLNESDQATNLDAPSSLVTVGPGWTQSTIADNYQGTGYYTQSITSDYAAATDVRYAPTLADGDYDIYVWVAGSSNGELFANEQTFEIREGSGTPTLVEVNMNTGKGWVKLGTRRFDHTSSSRLTVHALNFSDLPADATRSAYADTVRFVGAGNLAINSTPIHVNSALIRKDPNGAIPPVATDVDIVAAEDGRIYCLDSQGNGDGTTTIYWTYPSTPDPNNASWTDPNHAAGFDGPDGIAEMPTNAGFDLSSGLVERIDGFDKLYIAARNGRVYCIDVTGRGDFNTSTRRPGTTTRLWTYPDDYPATAKKTNLGAITGSVSFANIAAGPTIYVPAPQGRIYALDARPHANRTTVARWQYPAATDPTLGEISMTPALGPDNIYFGTKMKDEETKGEFYALDLDDGSVVWKFDGTASIAADDFTAGPAYVPSSEFRNGSYPQASTVFVANDNRFIYALDAAGNGDGTTSIKWSTDELGTTASASLSFLAMQTYTTSGAVSAASQAILMVPTSNGRMVGLFADGQLNRFGTRRAWEYDTGDAFIASVANGRGWMYGASSGGYLLAFNAGLGYISPGTPPGQQVIVENDASADIFRECKIKLISEKDYRDLRVKAASTSDPLTYTWLESLAQVTGSPLAFEWGQTVYAVVYKFPHATLNTVGATVAEPSVNFVFSVEGATTRTVTVASAPLFHGGAGNPPVAAADGVTLLDGYAAISFPIQPGGGLSLAPGNGVMTYSISASSLNSTGARQTIALDSTTSRREFLIANPLALLMNGKGDLSQSIGYSTNPADDENKVNGNPRGTVNSKVLTRLTAETGLVSHGTAQSRMVSIVDRSLMVQLYGWDRGLTNIRVQRNDLAWRGGAASVYKPLDAGLYPNYEDLPLRYPNDSLDYPDITRERLTFISDPAQNPSNPIFSGVELNPPTRANTSDPVTSRALVPTDMQIQLDVPRFQPFNVYPALNSASNQIAAGYMGSQYVYVDNGNGQFNRSGGQRNAYRMFRFAGNVDADERMSVTTPTVDNGSLAQGHGFSPLAPWNTANTLLNPAQDQSPTYTGKKYFTTLNVVNEGNVNLRNLRLAKLQILGSSGLLPWPVYSLGNHENAWLEPLTSVSNLPDGYVFSNLDDDSRWRVMPTNILQKARVGDRVGTDLSLNPIRRANPNLNVNAAPLNASLPIPFLPSVAATVPIGFPVGTYAQTMRIINEDDGNTPDGALRMDNNGAGLETYSDPTFILRFMVRESRLTNSFTAGTVPMADSWTPTNELFLHRNVQPTAMRTPLGSLITAWASTRSNWDENQPGANAKLDDQWRIYMARLAGTTPQSVNTSTNPLRELGYFTPATGDRWFEKLTPGGSSTGAFPQCTTEAEANSLFNITTAGDTILINTVKFGSPSLPTNGLINPLTSSDNPNAYMAFLGEAQLQTATGRAILNKMFIAPITLGSGSAPTVGAPIMAANDDSRIQKSKPSVLQVGETVTMMFGGGSTGNSQLMYMSYDPSFGWTPIRTFSTGGGFEYTTSPSMTLRRFASTAGGSQLPQGQEMLEISFVGKLRSRPNSEVFFGRVKARANGMPDGSNNPIFLYLPNKDQEPLVSNGQPGVYRADGVAWNLRNTIRLEQTFDGNTYTDLEVAGTRTYDQSTGLITFTTKLGGKAYLDPGAGTVRFASTVPPKNALLVLSYQPRFLRISGTGVNAGHSSPSILFDNRLVAEASYWVGLAPTDGSARYVHTYVKTSPGATQTKRPYLKSYRLGVQLPYAIATQPNGFVVSLTVNGNSGAYQVDPANGRVFFTAVDEAKPVRIQARLKLPNGSFLDYDRTSYVSFTTEREEAPVTIEQAVSESGMYAFLDPMNLAGNFSERRPGLIWLFWTSTRAGAPDIYFETIAPRFTPVPPGQ